MLLSSKSQIAKNSHRNWGDKNQETASSKTHCKKLGPSND